jgi:hypothetical protein
MPNDTTKPVLPAREVTLGANGAAEQTTVTATVVHIQRRDETSFFGPAVGLEGQLEILTVGAKRTGCYFVSRLVDEPYWVIDAHFAANGAPIFSHGFGARYTKLTGLHPALEALLDEAARDRGLAAEIGPEVPLVLASTATDAEAIATELTDNPELTGYSARAERF